MKKYLKIITLVFAVLFVTLVFATYGSAHSMKKPTTECCPEDPDMTWQSYVAPLWTGGSIRVWYCPCDPVKTYKDPDIG